MKCEVDFYGPLDLDDIDNERVPPDTEILGFAPPWREPLMRLRFVWRYKTLRSTVSMRWAERWF